MSIDEPFRLQSPPTSARGRLVATIRDQHRERDRVARMDAEYRVIRERAFIVVSGETLIAVQDPQEGETLSSVIEAASRWRGDDVVIYQGGKIAAVIRRARNGRKIVTLFP